MDAETRQRLDAILGNNRAWADGVRRDDPQFFRRLSQQQAPKYLWIGCSDSRVPANQILGLAPGEVFVHRNIANVVVHSDLNCLSVMQFAIDVLKVEHILIVGHYGCGGVHAALHGTRVGLADNWIRHVADVAQKHGDLLSTFELDTVRHGRLCELNTIEQTLSACQTTVVRDAWDRGQRVSLHGMVYGLHDGRLHRLGMDVSDAGEVQAAYDIALTTVRNSGREA